MQCGRWQAKTSARLFLHRPRQTKTHGRSRRLNVHRTGGGASIAPSSIMVGWPFLFYNSTFFRRMRNLLRGPIRHFATFSLSDEGSGTSDLSDIVDIPSFCATTIEIFLAHQSCKLNNLSQIPRSSKEMIQSVYGFQGQ